MFSFCEQGRKLSMHLRTGTNWTQLNNCLFNIFSSNTSFFTDTGLRSQKPAEIGIDSFMPELPFLGLLKHLYWCFIIFQIHASRLIWKSKTVAHLQCLLDVISHLYGNFITIQTWMTHSPEEAGMKTTTKKVQTCKSCFHVNNIWVHKSLSADSENNLSRKWNILSACHFDYLSILMSICIIVLHHLKKRKKKSTCLVCLIYFSLSACQLVCHFKDVSSSM